MQGLSEQTIAISATFTAEPISESLAFWLQKLNLPARVAFAPYNQPLQQLLDPVSLFSTNRSGINVLLVCLEHWMGRGSETTAGTSADPALKKNLEDLVKALTGFEQRSQTPILLLLCPPSPAALRTEANRSKFRDAEQFLNVSLSQMSTARFSVSSELATAYPVDSYYDPHTDELGHIPYTAEFFAALGTALARKIYGLRRPPYKVIATDCDDVLWKGICGEAGPHGVELDPARKLYQEFLIQQRRAGVLLCLCSKNNEEDVFEVLERRSDMPLKREHIIAWRINWAPKSQNLRELARGLNLGLDSFIFLDDNPIECAEVRSQCPEVLALQLPKSGEQVEKFLRHIWPLDIQTVTEEDLKRTQLYRQNLSREQVRKSSLTIADFLAQLELEVQIKPAQPGDFARVAQLTQRTNQFNCTTFRRSESEIAQICSSEAECLAIEVKDRFGDYGLVGVVIYRSTGTALDVETFLFSCRVLGRGVEHRVLAFLGEQAKSRHLRQVDLQYRRTPKNRPAEEFLEAVAGKYRQAQGDHFVFHIPAIEATTVTAGESITEPSSTQDSWADPVQRVAAPWALIEEIAGELSDVPSIARALRAHRIRGKIRRVDQQQSARSPLEQAVRNAWSEVLGIDEISICDHFFNDLGGDSLLGTQVISRLRQLFGLPLPLRVLFEAPTVSGLSILILENLAQQERRDEVAGMLAELEGATDVAPVPQLTARTDT
jgi:FkbH-like protein